MTATTTTAFLASLQTGDLVFFHGNAPLSRVIQWAQGSPWSHVALAVRLPGSPDHVAFWEAVRTSEGLAALPVPGTGPRRHPLDPGERDVRSGVRLVDGTAKLRTEAGAGWTLRLGVRRLTVLPAHLPSRRALTRRLLAEMAPLDGRPYARRLTTLLWSWVDLCDACGWTWNGNPGTEAYEQDGLFCSELVVVTLAAAGVLHLPHAPGTPVPPASRQAVAAECTVADLCAPRRFDEPLLHGTGARYRDVEVHTLCM